MQSNQLAQANDFLTSEEEWLLRTHQELKLQIELVPASCLWSNVRSNVGEDHWSHIRRIVFEKANFLCEICAGRGRRHPVECHDVWVFEKHSLTQRLHSFQALCPYCHEVKHLGLTGLRGNGKRAFARFVKLNQLDEQRAVKIENALFKQWEIRSDYYWKLDISHLKLWAWG